MSFPILETKRLKLVEIGEEFADNVFSIFSNEEILRFYGMSPFTQKEQAVKLIQSFSKSFQEKRSMRWGILLKGSSEFVGTIGLNNLQISSKRTEIGYDLLPEHWRKGIVSEAVEAVVNYCFNELDLYRIGAFTFLENEASYTLLLKIGFQKEGLLRGYLFQDGKSHDALIFSLIKPDYNNRIELSQSQ